jgi:tetratricopeptide (TPR) repeat protein
MRLVLLFLSGCFTLIAGTAPSEASVRGVYALLIGVSDYGPLFDLPPLRFAASDAEAFRTFLKTRRGGSVADDHITLLTDGKATLDRIRSELRSVRPNGSDSGENTLIVFLSGHGGDWNGKPYFLPYNSTAENIRSTALPLSDLKTLLLDHAGTFQKVIVLIDICRASETGFSAAHLDWTSNSDSLATQVAVLMATSGTGEYAYESETFGPPGHGALSFAVLEALNGKAITASSELTFEDVRGYVQGRVQQLTRKSQMPSGFASGAGITLPVHSEIPPDDIPGPGEPMPAKDARTTKISVSLYRQHRAAIKSDRDKAAAEQAGGQGAYGQLSDNELLAAAREVEGTASTALTQTVRENVKQIRVTLEDRGQDVIGRYLKGEQEAMNETDFTRCADYFREAQRLDPIGIFDRSRELFCEGRAAVFDRNWKRALELLTAAKDLDEEPGGSWNAIGLVYLEQANYDTATDYFAVARDHESRWVYPLHNTALTELERGNILAAVDNYKRAMELAADLDVAYSYLPLNLGLLYQNVNRLDDAERYYREAIKTAEDARSRKNDPGQKEFRERAVAFNALATIEFARKRYKRAMVLVGQALDDSPTLAQAMHNKALLLIRMTPGGISAEAESLWHCAIATDPPAVVERVALAEYLKKNRRVQEAEDQLKQLLYADPANVDGLRLLGMIYLGSNQASKALPLLDQVRAILPGDAPAWEDYASAASAAGRVDEAALAFQKAMGLYNEPADRKRVKQRVAALHSHG